MRQARPEELVYFSPGTPDGILPDLPFLSTISGPSFSFLSAILNPTCCFSLGPLSRAAPLFPSRLCCSMCIKYTYIYIYKYKLVVQKATISIKISVNGATTKIRKEGAGVICIMCLFAKLFISRLPFFCLAICVCALCIINKFFLLLSLSLSFFFHIKTAENPPFQTVQLEPKQKC